MLKCREVTRLLSDGQERALRRREKMNLYLHLMWCGGCRNFAKQLKTLRHFTHAYVQGKDAADPERKDTPPD
jgi:hypothetical protein